MGVRKKMFFVILIMCMTLLQKQSFGFSMGYHCDLIREVLQHENFDDRTIRLVLAANEYTDIFGTGESYMLLDINQYITRDANLEGQIKPLADFFHTTQCITLEQLRKYNEMLIQNMDGFINQQQDSINKNLGNINIHYSKMLIALGISLHCIEDLYAHTNWSELKMPYFFKQLKDATFFDLYHAPREELQPAIDSFIQRGFPKSSNGIYSIFSDEAAIVPMHDDIKKDYAAQADFDDAYCAAFKASLQWVRWIESKMGSNLNSFKTFQWNPSDNVLNAFTDYGPETGTARYMCLYGGAWKHWERWSNLQIAMNVPMVAGGIDIYNTFISDRPFLYDIWRPVCVGLANGIFHIELDNNYCTTIDGNDWIDLNTGKIKVKRILYSQLPPTNQSVVDAAISVMTNDTFRTDYAQVSWLKLALPTIWDCDNGDGVFNINNEEPNGKSDYYAEWYVGTNASDVVRYTESIYRDRDLAYTNCQVLKPCWGSTPINVKLVIFDSDKADAFKTLFENHGLCGAAALYVGAQGGAVASAIAITSPLPELSVASGLVGLYLGLDDFFNMLDDFNDEVMDVSPDNSTYDLKFTVDPTNLNISNIPAALTAPDKMKTTSYGKYIYTRGNNDDWSVGAELQISKRKPTTKVYFEIDKEFRRFVVPSSTNDADVKLTWMADGSINHNNFPQRSNGTTTSITHIGGNIWEARGNPFMQIRYEGYPLDTIIPIECKFSTNMKYYLRSSPTAPPYENTSSFGSNQLYYHLSDHSITNSQNQIVGHSGSTIKCFNQSGDWKDSAWLKVTVDDGTAPNDPCNGAQGGGNGFHGTAFGLDPPWTAGSEYCKATDGDINTFYDYSPANHGKTGLDLGTAKVIGRIRYYPRAGWASRMVGGKFQGSNDGLNFTDLYTVTSTPPEQWNEVEFSNSTAYRWVRYLSPDGGHGNIAEMEFYGPDVCFNTQGGGSGFQGTTFGLMPSWSDGSEYCRATDGDINTFYDYSQANGGFTGIDFGAAKVVGKIRYYPRTGYGSRMVGGKFQGSNTSSSSGFVDLYTITSTPPEQWNEVTFSNSTPYRWVRYLSPDGGFCNIAEMEFYEPDVCLNTQGGGGGFQGTTFGLTPSWSAGTEYCKASDGNINTFYDYSNANGAYTGLDLGSAKAIGKIRYYPRTGYGSRMVGGKFQGSNTSSSSGFVDLYTISGTPAEQWNEVLISNPAAYRWVRYLSPDGGYGNIAEMEFYEPVQYTISASAGANGSISPSGNVVVTGGTTPTFTITPNSGFNVSTVMVGNTNQGAITSYTFPPVSANQTISATFVAIDPCAGVKGGGNGFNGVSFGLTPAYAAGSEYCKATDGNINTFYDAQQADGAYTGLDLGSTKVIGKIRYYPRSGWGGRMTGGKFQGSNTSNNSGFVDLYTISGTPAVQWNEVNITNPAAYRWVRYLAPAGGYGNIAEMEFCAPPPQYLITASADVNGTINPNGIISVTSGNSQNFTITPNNGYSVSALSVDDTIIGAYTSYTFLNVTKNHKISATFVSNNGIYEAEKGGLAGGAAVNTNHTGYSGTGFVDGFFNSTTARVSFYVNVAAAGTYTAKLRYSAGNGTSTNTGLNVNGTYIKNITCPATSNWDTWADETETVTLAAGYNTIYYIVQSASTSCINLDKLTLTALCTPPTIVSSPASASVCVGSSAIMMVNASGATSWQWYKGSTALTNSSYYAGAQAAKFTINVSDNSVAGSYYCVCSNGSCPVTSGSATLTVNAKPTITANPSNTSICEALGNATMTVTATGATQYEWHDANGILTDSKYYTGTNTATLKFIYVPSAWNGTSYYCIVKNSSGCSATSSSAILTVYPVPIMNSIWNSSWYNHQGVGGNPNGNFWVQVDAPAGTTAYLKITNPAYPQFNRTTQVTGQSWPEVSGGNINLAAGTITVEYWCVNANGCQSPHSTWTNPAW